ncbi:MAG: hypothetical protein J6V90_02785 [Treponema sp.]|nr:hypothetical protein [Treponema sp.]
MKKIFTVCLVFFFCSLFAFCEKSDLEVVVGQFFSKGSYIKFPVSKNLPITSYYVRNNPSVLMQKSSVDGIYVSDSGIQIVSWPSKISLIFSVEEYGIALDDDSNMIIEKK